MIRTRQTVFRTVLTVFLIVLCVIFLIPTALTLCSSLMSQESLTARYGAMLNALGDGEGAPADVGLLQGFTGQWTLQQYADVLLRNPEYLLKFWNSVFLVFPIVLGQVAVASMAAYSLARVKTRPRAVIFFFYIVLMLMPYQVTLVPQYLTAKWLGILNTRWAIIFPGVFAPFSVFLLTRFMQRIPSSYIEAARLDGANEWQVFTRICLPQCRGVLYAVLILVFLDYWNMVEQPLILFSDADQYPLSIFLSSVNEQDIAIAFAAAALYMLPPLLLFLHGEQHLISGIAQTGSAASAAEKPRRRRWAIGALAAFLAVMGLVTVLRGPIMDRWVPRVLTDAVKPAGIGSENYPVTVSPQAILSDEDGEYVLAVTAKDSAFGQQFVARRVAVSVVRQDGKRAAVDGDLLWGDSVITAYSSLPQDNTRVRPQTAD